MSNLSVGLTIVMMVNVMLFLGQAAVLALNTESNTTEFYNYSGGLLAEFDEGNNTLTGDDPGGLFPTEGGALRESATGNLFTDTFSVLKQWFLEATGLKYVFAVLAAPYHLLSSIGLPQTFVFAIGSMWYGITLFLLIAFIFGRDA